MEVFVLGVLFSFVLRSAAAGPQAPAIFVFGDSIVDAGNNNYLNTTARANHPPNGFKFPDHEASGRFCDGRLVVDLIAQHLGLPYPPPYLSFPSNLQQGVSFASASSGILPSTGIGPILTLSRQVDAFVRVKQNLTNQLGESAADQLVSKAIFYVSTGNNDINTPNRRHSLEDIISYLGRQLLRLYSAGARKFAVVGLSDTGCVPLTQESNGTCNPSGTSISKQYNNLLQNMLKNNTASLTGFKGIYTNFALLLEEVIGKPQPYGFINTHQGCCPGNDPQSWCYANAPHCSNSSDYLFWDRVHPTEAFNTIAANKWYSGSSPDVTPFNIQELARCS